MSELDESKTVNDSNDREKELDRQAEEIMARLMGNDDTDEETASDEGEQDGLDASIPVTGETDDGFEMEPEIPETFDVVLPSETVGSPSSDVPVDLVTPAITTSQPVQQQAVTMEEAERPKGHGFLTFLLFLVVLAAGAYIAGAIVFMSRFMPNTTINGEDVSLQTVEEVAQANSDSIDSFGLSVTGDGLNLNVKAADIKASYDGNAYASEAMAQQEPWTWPLEVANTHELTAETRMSYDEKLLDKVVGDAVDAVNKDAKKPTDAKIVKNDKTKRYEVKAEEMGTLVDRDAILELARSAVKDRQVVLEIDEGQLVKPKVLSDDKKLNDTVKKVNASLDAKQDIVTGDSTVATVDDDLLQKWVKVADDYSVSFDTDACTKWARGELSEKLDTIGTKRSYTFPDGRSGEVTGGTYGWCCDGAAIASAISENVLAGKAGEVGVTWLVEAAKWNPGGQDWGDRFIEIDLGAQHVKMFDGSNVIWEADCVTGKTADGHDTPQGVYYINDNMQSGNVELRGEIDPKTNEPEYISYVKYWMPFIGNGYALHDADWRSSFGGDIYKNDGSHGCVNLPPDKAAELYGLVSVGTVVVVHW